MLKVYNKVRRTDGCTNETIELKEQIYITIALLVLLCVEFIAFRLTAGIEQYNKHWM